MKSPQKKTSSGDAAIIRRLPPPRQEWSGQGAASSSPQGRYGSMINPSTWARGTYRSPLSRAGSDQGVTQGETHITCAQQCYGYSGVTCGRPMKQYQMQAGHFFFLVSSLCSSFFSSSLSSFSPSSSCGAQRFIGDQHGNRSILAFQCYHLDLYLDRLT